tara:strand:- start:21978 stop:22451 length:474 start_codon:yes stop_codon:yes gene_type:complete
MKFLDLALNNEHLKVFILSMLPITELRGSIPWGIKFYSLSVYEIVLISIIGNILIGVLILYAIGPIMYILSKNNLFKNFLNYIFKRTKKKGKMIYFLKFYGLILFVGIPMPLTGVWTGSLAAFLFGLSRKKSIIAITLGVLISSFIVTSISVFSIKL